MRRPLPAALLLALATTLPAVAAAPTPETADPHAIVHGMTISCHSWGWEWGTDEMVESMSRLRDLGVNWIAIHPYAGIRADGTVVMPDRYYEDRSWLTRPIAEAHRLGLKTLIKPHIAYWGSPFGWRGEIAFQTDEQWQRFFETYERWVTTLAEICTEADAFSVGTELDLTVHHEQRWRQVITSVRDRSSVPLTYAANWDRYEQVPFWDALDVIGIQGYFPLVDHDRLPELQELEAGWEAVLNRLERFAARHHRNVLLSELGYNRSALAARRPWEHRQGGPNADEIQRRCLTAALRALEGHETVVGAFLWKWFPGEARRGNFLKSTPAMQQVIAEHWSRD